MTISAEDCTGQEPPPPAPISDGATTVMARLTDLHYWLARWLEDDTVLALKLLALTNDEYPELEELAFLLDRVSVLIGVFMQRLEGAEIVEMEGEYLCIPLPRL